MTDETPTEPISVPSISNQIKSTENGDEVLYKSALHLKFFLKKAVKPFFVGLLPLVLIALLIAGGIWLQGVSPTSSQLSTFWPLPWGVWLIIILIALLWMVICAFLIYRSYFEWQHTGIILTWQSLRLIRPNSRLLFLKRAPQKGIETQRITGYDLDAPTTWELYVFRNSITFSVIITAQEGRGKSPVDHLADVRNPKVFGKALDSIIARNQAHMMGV